MENIKQAIASCYRQELQLRKNWYSSAAEWELEAEAFDAVLAASSFHWIPPDLGYAKAARALRDNGSLILLWNKELQPRQEIYRELSEIYDLYAPNLARYEDRGTQLQILRELGQMAIDSGQFTDLKSGYLEVEVIYPVDRYLALLTTYSSYLKLDSSTQKALFAGLKSKLENISGDTLKLSYLSAFHVNLLGDFPPCL